MLLVTGANGLLGSNLVREALGQGLRVRAAGREPLTPMAAAEPVAMRLEAGAFDDLFDGGVRLVVHCAALTDVDRCEREPGLAHALNAQASGRLAEAARRAGAGFLYVSTDAVYKGDRAGWREDDATQPVNAYAASKLAGEAAVLRSHPDALVVRTNLYGWNLRPRSSLGEWALRELEAGKSPRGLADVFFSPLEAGELAGLLLAMAGAGCRGVYNLGSADGCSKLAFVRLIAAAFGHDPERVREAVLADMPFAAPRPRDTRLDSSRARAALGRELPTVADGVERFRRGFPADWTQRRPLDAKEERDG